MITIMFHKDEWHLYLTSENVSINLGSNITYRELVDLKYIWSEFLHE